VGGDGHFLGDHRAGGLVGGAHDGSHRHDLVVELAGLAGGSGTLLAARAVLVLRFLGDVVALGHGLRGLQHGPVELRLVLGQPLFLDVLGVDVGLHGGDGLHAAGDHDRRLVDDDVLGGHGNGLQAGRAEAVDGDAGHADRQAGADGGHAGDVVALRAFRQGAAEDHVVDLAAFDAGTLDRVLDGMGGQGGAVGQVEAAAPGLRQRRAGGGNDHYVSHVYPLVGGAGVAPPRRKALVEGLAFGGELREQRGRLPELLVGARPGRDPLDGAHHVHQANPVGIEHRPAAEHREAVAGEVDHVDVGSPQGDAFLEDARALIDQGVDAALDDFLIGNLARGDAQLLAHFVDHAIDFRIRNGVAATRLVAVEAGAGLLAE